ncbi:MAG: PspC domain-containing protein [Corynebacterium sp.]|uniref:ATP-binding protein n=1 Tax=Corynebacterium sp. TaxID=1720 RepID=UPI0026F88407|nr:PspC domain-containing protein [Corynebacterium sp.]
MTISPPAEAYPTYTRPTRHRVIAGVAAGLALHLRVDVLWVRLAFVVLTGLSGLGALAYAGLWVFTRQADLEAAPPEKRSLSRGAYWVLAAVGMAVAALAATTVTNLPGWALLPLLIVGAGVFLAWRGYDRGTGVVGSLLGGAALMLAGLISGLAVWNTGTAFVGAMFAVLFTLAGVAAFAVPALVKVRDSLAEKAAAEEREEIASRLHDSVLQTLALIQKRADDPAEVARLARGQERELRTWLFEPQDSVELTVFGAVDKAAGEVEDLFGVRIAPVTVGSDQPLGEATQAVVLAAREAMVNAAKHAGVDNVDVYAETFDGLEVFVRDRGRGFDPQEIPEDRHGIRDSIRGRVAKVGGSVEIKSAPGEGTEVILRTW